MKGYNRVILFLLGRTMKLKFKLLLAALVVCLIVFSLIFFVRSPDAKFATVLSTEPIKSNRLVEYENCSVTGVLGSFSQESLSRFHPAQSECKMVFMIEALQGKLFFPFSNDEERTCVKTQRMEQVIVGYDVVYRIGNSIGKVRAGYDPGMFIPLNDDGRLNLTLSNATVCETLRSDVKDVVPFYCIKQSELALNKDASQVLELQPSKNTYGFFE
ncbi:Uncharacterised protein [Providencia heimbachae]|uniref:UmoD family protein n=2 Tax=Morganellaceae TaxID=1903414 RepID=A0A1B7JHE2_9GAMM|nr:UmoD family protein [Providencia heimbachae ATCC 35613]SQH12965.1 Uncharacterised protein [Providencia heimbachae]